MDLPINRLALGSSALSLILLLAPARGPEEAYRPHPMAQSEQLLAEGHKIRISVEDYEDYLLARLGTSFVEDLAFDLCLARACKARKLATDAVLQARKHAETLLSEFGQGLSATERADKRTRAINEELRRIRVTTLLRLSRSATEADLRAEFESKYGVGGDRVRLRHILISFHATESRLQKESQEPVTRAKVERAARETITAIQKRIASGKSFISQLKFSDDANTRSLLRHPTRRSEAGLLPGYNYQRFGAEFADAVRALDAKAVSAPVRSSHGYHLIYLIERKHSDFEKLRPEIEKAWRNRPIESSEYQALKKRLFQAEGVRIGPS